MNRQVQHFKTNIHIQFTYTNIYILIGQLCINNCTNDSVGGFCFTTFERHRPKKQEKWEDMDRFGIRLCHMISEDLATTMLVLEHWAVLLRMCGHIEVGR